MGLVMGSWNGLIAATAFVVGGLWLSPDLDTHSNALRRWGPLRFIWWPYRRLLPHRSVWSHGPVVGTAVRLCVLLGWLTILVMLLPGVALKSGVNAVQHWIDHQPAQVLALVLGLEASVWLHLILDGDPWPVEWSRRRHQ